MFCATGAEGDETEDSLKAPEASFGDMSGPWSWGRL